MALRDSYIKEYEEVSTSPYRCVTCNSIQQVAGEWKFDKEEQRGYFEPFEPITCYECGEREMEKITIKREDTKHNG